MTGALGGRWAATAVLIAVFASGALSGAAVMRVVEDRATVQPERERRGERERRPDRRRGDGHRSDGRFRGSPDRFLSGLTRRLELTPDQEDRIRAILTESRTYADSVYEEVEPRIRAHLNETQQEVRSVLTEEQRERYDEMFRRMRSRGPPRGGPPGEPH